MRRLLVLAAVVVALTGCGGDEGAGPRAGRPPAKPLTLALDFTPNAIHAPLFAAVREGLDRKRGVSLEIRKPGPGPDVLKLVASGRAQLGVADIHDLAIARERGADVVAVAALVERPLAALIARPPVTRPRDLEGRTVGVSGLPSDPAFLNAIVAADGGDPAKVRQVTIGFKGVPGLLAGRVDAVPLFWSAEGVALRERGLDTREFRVGDYGAPPYPEEVLITSSRTLRADRAALGQAIMAIGDGIRVVRADPGAAARDVAEQAQTSDIGLVRAQLDAVSPLFGLRLDPRRLAAWARFDARIGIVDRPPDVDAAFDLALTRDLPG